MRSQRRLVNPIDNIDRSLIFNYRFNEISGTTLIDHSGNNLNGINNGVLINQTGKIDKSYLFRGSPENIVIADSPKIQFGTGDFTFCTWINLSDIPSATNAQATIVSKNYTGFEVSIYQSKLLAYLGGAAIGNQLIGNTIFNTNQWYFIILQRKNSVASFEINRVGDVSKTITSDISRIGQALNLGRRPGGTSGQYFKGNMDAMSLYNYALSEAQKDDLFNNGNGIEYNLIY